MTHRVPPSFAQHLWLLWKLRLTLSFNQLGKRGWAARVVGLLASGFPGLALGVTFFRLMHLPAIAHSGYWSDFILNLLCFVTASVWTIWPVLSASIDDHSELSRYAAFPISPSRLMLASMLASLFEPRAWVTFAPLLGAAAGYLDVYEVQSVGWVVPLFLLFAFFSVALSRMALHVLLWVLRRQDNLQLLGGFALGLLALAALIPPVDTRWLTQIQTGLQAVPDSIIKDAALALGRFPTGWFGHALRALRLGKTDTALLDGVGLVVFSLGVFAVASWLLKMASHQHQVKRAKRGEKRAYNPFVSVESQTFTVLAAREALDLWHNPRARLLFFVPFVLSVLLKILSGRDLFVFMLGKSSDAWLMGGLCVYGAVIIGFTFAQNSFGYDGHGFRFLLVAPVELRRVLKAKNLVHGLSALAMAALVAVFYVGYFHSGSPRDILNSLVAVMALLPVLLASGNFLSLFYPVKFHVNLKRRDRLPWAASMLGVGAASVGTAPFVWLLKQRGELGLDFASIAALAGCALLGWLVYAASFTWAANQLWLRRQWVLSAVTRD